VAPSLTSTTPTPAVATDWHRDLAQSIRNPQTLLDRLGLDHSLLPAARDAGSLFPVMVPESFLARMRPGDPHDPLLKQVLPVAAELESTVDTVDAVGDLQARLVPGLIQKYQGRALLIATGSCAVHCRYCFRRHYPYQDEPRRLDEWDTAIERLARDQSIDEVILSGGDPLMLSDIRLDQLIRRLETIPHLKRIRIHTRLPIVLPSRVTRQLCQRLRDGRLTPLVVVHANHPSEVVDDCAQALAQLVQSGLTVLNQSVLLAGINDDSQTLANLCTRLVNLGVIPYYLHQLDKVAGTLHFEVPETVGRELVRELATQLPGYAVPRYVQEVPGADGKVPL
jgi:EF-P beta-lysylation protein EpmB